MKEPVFEGVLPMSYPEGKVTAEPEEIIDGTAYFYDPTFTVQNNHIYTLPMTGSRNLPLIPMGIVLTCLGISMFVAHHAVQRTCRKGA